MDFEFGKAPKVAAIDAVPEQFRPLYQQADDGYVLNESFQGLGNAIDGLNRSLKAARRDADTANRSRPDMTQYAAIGQMLGIEGDDAASAEAIRTAVETALQQSKDGKVNWDKMKRDLEVGFNAKLQTKDGELQTMGKSLQKYLVTTAAVQAIAAHKGVPDLLLPHIQARTKVIKDTDDYVVRVVDEAGDPRGNAAGGFMSVDDLVKELKAHATFGRAFESEALSGNGTKPGNGGQKLQVRQPAISPVDKIRAGLDQRQRQR